MGILFLMFETFIFFLKETVCVNS